MTEQIKITMDINGEEWVRADSITSPLVKTDGMDYVIVRSYDAGVFAGYLKERDRANNIVVLVNARRLWRWSGAASLSQLAVDGIAKPNDCKFPVAVPQVELSRICEIIPVSKKAKRAIDGVKIWRA